MKTKLILISQCRLLWNIDAINFVLVACFLTWLLDLVKFEWFICSSCMFQLVKINTSETRIDTKISFKNQKNSTIKLKFNPILFSPYIWKLTYKLKFCDVLSQDEQCDTAQKMKFSVMDLFNKCDQICRIWQIWSIYWRNPP